MVLEEDNVSKEMSEFSTGVERQDKTRSITRCNDFWKRKRIYGAILSYKMMSLAI